MSNVSADCANSRWPLIKNQLNGNQKCVCAFRMALFLHPVNFYYCC